MTEKLSTNVIESEERSIVFESLNTSSIEIMNCKNLELIKLNPSMKPTGTNFSLKNCPKLQNIDFITAFSSLESLELHNLPQLSDFQLFQLTAFPSLKNLSLHKINLPDPEIFKTLNLESLSLSFLTIDSLSFLSDEFQPELRSVRIISCEIANVCKLCPLQKLKLLELSDVRECENVDFCIRNCELEQLELQYVDFAQVDGVHEGLKCFKCVKCNNLNLEVLPKQLEALEISHNFFSFHELEKFTNLKCLALDDCFTHDDKQFYLRCGETLVHLNVECSCIENLDFVLEFKVIEFLEVRFIKDLSVLVNFENLHYFKSKFLNVKEFLEAIYYAPNGCIVFSDNVMEMTKLYEKLQAIIKIFGHEFLEVKKEINITLSEECYKNLLHLDDYEENEEQFINDHSGYADIKMIYRYLQEETSEKLREYDLSEIYVRLSEVSSFRSDYELDYEVIDYDLNIIVLESLKTKKSHVGRRLLCNKLIEKEIVEKFEYVGFMEVKEIYEYYEDVLFIYEGNERVNLLSILQNNKIHIESKYFIFVEIVMLCEFLFENQINVSISLKDLLLSKCSNCPFNYFVKFFDFSSCEFFTNTQTLLIEESENIGEVGYELLFNEIDFNKETPLLAQKCIDSTLPIEEEFASVVEKLLFGDQDFISVLKDMQNYYLESYHQIVNLYYSSLDEEIKNLDYFSNIFHFEIPEITDAAQLINNEVKDTHSVEESEFIDKKSDKVVLPDFELIEYSTNKPLLADCWSYLEKIGTLHFHDNSFIIAFDSLKKEKVLVFNMKIGKCLNFYQYLFIDSLYEFKNQPSILKIIEYFEYDHYLTILFEYKSIDSITNVSKVVEFDIHDVIMIIAQLFLVVQFCHSNNCIIRNIHPDSVMLCQESLLKFEIVLFDFKYALFNNNRYKTHVQRENEALSNYLGESVNIQYKNNGVKREIECPEMLNGLYETDVVDSWEIGILIYYLCNKCFPLDDEELKEEFQELEFLIDLLLQKEAKNRSSIEELLRLIIEDDEEQLTEFCEKYNFPEANVRETFKMISFALKISRETLNIFEDCENALTFTLIDGILITKTSEPFDLNQVFEYSSKIIGIYLRCPVISTRYYLPFESFQEYNCCEKSPIDFEVFSILKIIKIHNVSGNALYIIQSLTLKEIELINCEIRVEILNSEVEHMELEELDLEKLSITNIIVDKLECDIYRCSNYDYLEENLKNLFILKQFEFFI